jgi:hypothetical protein
MACRPSITRPELSRAPGARGLASSRLCAQSEKGSKATRSTLSESNGHGSGSRRIECDLTRRAAIGASRTLVGVSGNRCASAPRYWARGRRGRILILPHPGIGTLLDRVVRCYLYAFCSCGLATARHLRSHRCCLVAATSVRSLIFESKSLCKCIRSRYV